MLCQWYIKFSSHLSYIWLLFWTRICKYLKFVPDFLFVWVEMHLKQHLDHQQTLKLSTGSVDSVVNPSMRLLTAGGSKKNIKKSQDRYETEAKSLCDRKSNLTWWQQTWRRSCCVSLLFMSLLQNLFFLLSKEGGGFPIKPLRHFRSKTWEFRVKW